MNKVTLVLEGRLEEFYEKRSGSPQFTCSCLDLVSLRIKIRKFFEVNLGEKPQSIRTYKLRPEAPYEVERYEYKVQLGNRSFYLFCVVCDFIL